MTRHLTSFLWISMFVVLSIGASGCGMGGGGGGGEFVGAAVVSVTTSPSRIDVGGRTRTTSDISEVHENGIALKFRFPKGLSFVRDSAMLEVDGQEYGVDPDFAESSGAFKYVVFFLSNDSFGRHGYGRVSFELRGEDTVENGYIEVDADVDDPLIDNASEFSVDDPEFSAESDAYIEVVN